MTRSSNPFTPAILALLMTVLAGTVALMAWGTADRYLPELNITEPDMASFPPTIAHAPSRQTRRVVLVILDGLRLRDSFERPFLERLRRAGVDAIATSHYPTISRPNHTTIVTGVPPLISGVRNNTYRSPVLIDSLMDRIHAANLEASFVADYTSSLAYLFPDDFDAVHYGRWPGGLIKSTRLVLELERSALLVMIPGAIDEAGHAEGGDSQEYRDAVDRVDEQLSAALSLVDLEKDTIIVTADHGHTDAGGHGGEEPEVMQVPLIFAGAGIRTDALLGTAELTDVAPTAAALLGVAAPGHAVGRTLTEVLQVSDDERAAITASDRRRIERNTEIYLSSLKRASEKLGKDRRGRLLWIAGLSLLALVLLALARRAGALLIDWRVLLIAVPAYPLCYYGLLDVLGQSLSFSALQDRGSEMSNLFRFGMVATSVQVVAGWIALQGRVVLRDRLAAANALIACGLLVAWLPAGLLWAYHGPAPHIEIPGPTIALLIPANYIAVATYALGAAILLGLEIVVFFARAVDPRLRLRRLELAAARERLRLEKGK